MFIININQCKIYVNWRLSKTLVVRHLRRKYLIKRSNNTSLQVETFLQKYFNKLSRDDVKLWEVRGVPHLFTVGHYQELEGVTVSSDQFQHGVAADVLHYKTLQSGGGRENISKPECLREIKTPASNCSGFTWGDPFSAEMTWRAPDVLERIHSS